MWLCLRAGFDLIVLRGDTDFSQTEHLDRWNGVRNLRFVFGYDAMPNLKEIAENLPASAWKPLQRPAKYAVKTQPRRRPENVKDQIVRERKFDVLRLESEEVAEFDYRPTACANTYRMVVIRKHISKEKGEQVLWPEIRYHFYITNERTWTPAEVVFEANPGAPGLRPGEPARAVARRRACPASAGEHAGEQLGVDGDDGVGVDAQGVVGAAVAGVARPLAGAAP